MAIWRVACQPGRRAAKAGGAEGGRTPDLLIANEALSQLSYGPAKMQPSGAWLRVRAIYGPGCKESRIGRLAVAATMALR